MPEAISITEARDMWQADQDKQLSFEKRQTKWVTGEFPSYTRENAADEIDLRSADTLKKYRDSFRRRLVLRNSVSLDAVLVELNLSQIETEHQDAVATVCAIRKLEEQVSEKCNKVYARIVSLNASTLKAQEIIGMIRMFVQELLRMQSRLQEAVMNLEYDVGFAYIEQRGMFGSDEQDIQFSVEEAKARVHEGNPPNSPIGSNRDMKLVDAADFQPQVERREHERCVWEMKETGELMEFELDPNEKPWVANSVDLESWREEINALIQEYSLRLSFMQKAVQSV